MTAWLILFHRMLALALILLLPCMAFAEIDGFKGMRWGSLLADLQQTKQLVLIKDGGSKDASLYILENEVLRYGKATLIGINYSFTQQRLNGVMLQFKGDKEFAAVKAEAFAKLGETLKIDQNGEEMYNWSGVVTSSILSYSRKTHSGFLFLKAKKLPPLPKGAEKPRPSRPADQETALDKAPPPKTPFSPPSAQPTGPSTTVSGPPSQSMRASGDEPFTPEMLALLDRDQILTHQCWDTVGPAADSACAQMRLNAERLQNLGLCMSPADPRQQGARVIWRRCAPPSATPSPPATQSQMQPMPQTALQAPPSAPAPENQPRQRCRLIGELFADAAQMRDNGIEPQTTEEELLWRVTSETPEITLERVRETVELVYFDGEYSQIRGEQMIQRINDRCLNGRGPYAHPLP